MTTSGRSISAKIERSPLIARVGKSDCRRDCASGHNWLIASVGKSRAAVLRRSERRRCSSASDDEVGGLQARLRERSQLVVRRWHAN